MNNKIPFMGVKNKPFPIARVDVATTNFATLNRLRTKIDFGPLKRTHASCGMKKRLIERNIKS